MYYLKPRKFVQEMKHTPGWNSGLLWEVLSVAKVSYRLSEIGNANTTIVALGIAAINQWDPEKMLVMTVKKPGGRIVLAINDMTFDEFIKINKQVGNLKAFL